MGRLLLAIAIVISLALAALATGAGADRPAADELSMAAGGTPTAPVAREAGGFKEGHVIAKLKPQVPASSAEAIIRGAGGRELSRIPQIGAQLLQVPAGAEQRVAEALKKNPNVAYAEPNYTCHAFLIPDDPAITLAYQWNLDRIRAYQAWDISTGGNVRIAIVDTGISPTHPDLAGKVVWGVRYYGEGWSDSNWQDDNGHGTHVAGIASAVTNNGQGVAGVTWGASLLAVKVLDSAGNGDYYNVERGIVAAADQGARVINLSLGGRSSSGGLADAVRYAQDRGALVVAASGNYGDDTPMYPAAYANVVAVGATNIYDQWASYSCYGPHLWVAAPGGDGAQGVLSTYWSSRGDAYDWLAGTSMATPHVSGLAALLWSINPDISALSIRAILSGTADDLGAPGWDPYYGWGRINAERAARVVYLTVDPNAERVYVPLVERNFQ